MQRSIEQRERAAKELHSRIHELEGTESNLNQSYSTLSLKVCTFNWIVLNFYQSFVRTLLPFLKYKFH